jgi:putative sterol carrier protein
MPPNRPPSEITPTDFFERWLPAEYARVREAAPGPVPPDAAVQVSLEGEGGGVWTLSMRGGALEAKPEAAGEPDTLIKQSVQDWRALVIGEEGAIELVPAKASPMDLLLLDAGKSRALRDVKGTLRFEVTGFNDRTWSIEATLNGAAQPRSTIALDAQTYAEMLAGTLPPPQAYFAGKIHIGGDASFAMQLAMQWMAGMSSP